MKRLLQALEAAGRWAEDLLLSGILLTMICLASWQIIGRNFFGTNLPIGDELLRIMVLWLTLAGAVAASRADRHIAIALIDRYLDGWKLNVVRFINQFFTSAVCGLLAWYSLDFVQVSREFEDLLLRDTPAWILQAPLPLGFAIMCYRHGLLALLALGGYTPPRTPPGRLTDPESAPGSDIKTGTAR